MGGVIWAGVVVLAGYVVLAGTIFLRQRRLMYRPDTWRPDPPGIAGLEVVGVRTSDGLDLFAWWVPPRSANGAVLAYFHGNGGNLAHRAPRLGRFAALGWGVLMLEYRGYGGNPGAPSEAGFMLDAAAAMAFLERRGVPGERLVVFGESIGTGVAVPVAAERARAGQALAGLVLESPFGSMLEMARGRYPWLPVRLLLLDRFEVMARIGEVRAPLLVLQGGQDRVVPPASSQAVFDAAPDPKELWTAPGGGHEDLMEHGALDAVARFVRRVVG